MYFNISKKDYIKLMIIFSSFITLLQGVTCFILMNIWKIRLDRYKITNLTSTILNNLFKKKDKDNIILYLNELAKVSFISSIRVYSDFLEYELSCPVKKTSKFIVSTLVRDIIIGDKSVGHFQIDFISR